MKKKILAVVLFCIFALSLFALCACNKNDDDKLTVTWYDATGTTDVSKMPVLKTDKVEKGSKVSGYTPTKAGGYEFVDWFAVPSKGHRFDFSQPINEDTAIYGGFTKYQEDTRDFYLVGSGTSELLFGSNWGKVITDSYKLAKTQGANEYKITTDLIEGDEFQFAIDSDWHNQRGFGYLAQTALDDGTEVFSSNASPYSDAAKTTNIKVEHSGNYTLTLKTYPGDDYYETSAPNYTEETKETYNRGTYDTITWVRNGDVQNSVITITDFYIKGESITAWGDLYNPSTQMARNGSEYTLKVWLKQNDQFMFTSRVTKMENGESTVSVGSEYIKSNALDAASRAVVGGYTAAGGNMTALKSGEYTFSYNGTSKVLSVTFEEKAATAYDYYLDGDIGANGAWNAFVTSPDDYKLTETESGSGVYKITKQLEANKQIQIRACAAGEVPTTANTANNLYQFNYLTAAGDNFEAVDANNNNIKVKAAGNYDITIDSYSKIITIVSHIEGNDVFDIYIKGAGINNWEHGFNAQYRFVLSEDETTYEFELTVAEGTPVEFGFERHSKGETAGSGTWLGAGAMGTSGNANAQFTPDSGSNFKCSTAGTYKIVYDIATEKIDFYTVTD